jgi:3-hydroxybutyrate dehydrogenase
LKHVDEAAGDEWATPDEVALAMLDLVEKTECAAGKISGGTILEVGKDQVRLVEELNDRGPSGPGHTVHGNKTKALDETFDILAQDGWGR